MASAKELKDRIKAVQETKKITSAMYLIAVRSGTSCASARAAADAISARRKARCRKAAYAAFWCSRQTRDWRAPTT